MDEATWAVLELMGHRRLAGRLKEETIAGASLLRLDIFAGDEQDAAVTQFYSPSAIYCITPTTEDVCRRMGLRWQPEPVARYELPALPDSRQQELDYG